MPTRRRRRRTPRCSTSALAGVEELNERYGADTSAFERFHLFHRRRLWNESEGKWMGWERKRGKLEEFNRLLRGARDTSFVVATAEPELLAKIRYVITLDSDTQLPRDAARRLVGIARHPLNHPQFDERMGRVTRGYAILQPRVSVTLESAALSRFARIFSGNTGIDPYTTAASDVYQDLFGEGTFTGKGLYDVDAFERALAGRVPENALLSHDLFEGLYARSALVTDIEFLDDYPAHYDDLRDATAPLDARRLADSALAVSVRARRSSGAPCLIRCRSSGAGKFSTTCGAASSRQPSCSGSSLRGRSSRARRCCGRSSSCSRWRSPSTRT